MTRLRDLTVRDAQSWDDAAARFSWPATDRYNIAADCLGHPHDSPAIIVHDGGAPATTVTFGELDAMSSAVARELTGRFGVRRGDRVAVKLSQSLEMAVSVLAVLRAGAVVVPISNVLGADAIRHRLATSGPRVLIAAGTTLELAAAVEHDLAMITVEETAAGPSLRMIMRRRDEMIGPFADTGPDSPALLLFTSGTTGKSKGVLHGHRFLLGHHGVDYAFDLVRPDDVAYTPADWAWAGGLLLGLLVPLAHGVPVVAHRDPHFDVDAALAMFEDHGVSIGLFPPTVLRMLRRGGASRDSRPRLRLRCLITGAEAVEPELLTWALDSLGAVVNNAFGQTEANALVGHSSVLGRLDPTCLGRPYPGHEIAVVDERLDPVAPGTLGELAVRATDPVCLLGYWDAPDATAAKVRGGWLLTGDTVHRDERGQLHFHGRADDLIKSGGYRIGPAEDEAALLLDDSVVECAVVGLPDPVRGQAVTAFVRLRAGTTGSDALDVTLRELVRARVGAHAYPREFRYVDELPHTSTGKIDRAALRRPSAPAVPAGSGA
jgi:acetyl-CoA synthetase